MAADTRPKRAGSRKAVTAANLATLGAERLAAILAEAADEDPDLKRRLRMELAGEVGAEHLAAEVAKRLTAVETRRSRVHWRRYRGFVRDLQLQRSMIAGPLADQDPRLALELMWRFLALTGEVFRLVNDGRGEVEATFRAAADDTGEIVGRAKPDPGDLADRLVELIEADQELVLDGLAPAVLPNLDETGLAALRARLETQVAARARPAPRLRRALQLTADAQGDVDGFIAAIPPAEARHPASGAEIGRRLLGAGRVEDALAALARSAPSASGRGVGPGVVEWEDVFIAALEADGQTELAQDLRWSAFERRLSADRLRAYLRRLPDFDDVEAQDRAMAHAQTYPDFAQALRFLVEWPAPAEAAALVQARSGEIDARDPELAEAAAGLLAARHPLAASLLLRALAADTLRWGRADRYRDAERQVAELAALAVRVETWGEAETHEAFVTRLARFRRL